MQQLSRSKQLLDAGTEMSGRFPMDAYWLNGFADNIPCDDESICRLWNAMTSFGPIASFTNIIGSLLGFMYYNYFVRQIAKMYFLTPIMMGEIGGWGGLELSEICSQLTHVPASFWQVNLAECSQLVEKRFLGILALIEAIILLFVMYRMIYGLMALMGSIWKMFLSILAFFWRRRPGLIRKIFPPTPVTISTRASDSTHMSKALVRSPSPGTTPVARN